MNYLHKEIISTEFLSNRDKNYISELVIDWLEENNANFSLEGSNFAFSILVEWETES